MKNSPEMKMEGYSSEEILSMTDEELGCFVFTNEPMVFLIGSAKVLGEFRICNNNLVVELAQIEGGGEGILQNLWLITEQYAKKNGLDSVEWIVHAINCANPNLKLRRVLIKRGFVIVDISGIGEAYHYVNKIK